MIRRSMLVVLLFSPLGADGGTLDDGGAATRAGVLPGPIRYRVSSSARPGDPGPLVLGLHGRPRTPPLRPFRMLDVARHDPEGRAVVVAPFVPGARWGSSEARLVALTRRLAARPEVDAGRVVVAGFSAGAPAAIRLAAQHPDLFAGVLSASGRFPSGPLEALSAHGVRVLLSWSGAEARCRRTVELVEEIARRGGDARAVVFPGGRHVPHLEMLEDPDLWEWWTGAPGWVGEPG